MLRFSPILWVGLCLATAQCFAYSGGTGEPNDPYQIGTAQDLIDLGNEPNDYDKHFILTADIDLSGYTFDRAVIAPASYIGGRFAYWEIDCYFSGNFNGNGHIIRNLSIQEGSYLGLFGGVDATAVISNLGLEAVDIDDTGSYIGGLVGYNANYSTILSNYCTGSVSGYDDIGGLVGKNASSSLVMYSYSTGLVSGKHSVGGLVGCNSGDGSTTSSFWDTETSGKTYSASGTGLTTSQMLDIDTFLDEGWDFADETANGTEDIWWMPVSDYPRLWWELAD